MNKFDYFKVLHRAYALTILENSTQPLPTICIASRRFVYTTDTRLYLIYAVAVTLLRYTELTVVVVLTNEEEVL